MKIAFVGPIAPFRSGVAKHSTALASALVAQGADVRAFSFSRQYPQMLFPGEAQIDEGLTPPSDFPTEACIDTIWPPSWRHTLALIVDFAPDAAIIACWTFFTAPALAHIARGLRQAGIKVVAMVHNPNDHEGAAWKQALLTRQIRAADAAIVHSGPVAQAVAALAPELPVRSFPMPAFDSHPPSTTILPRRAALELLFFGLIRPYKGLDVLLDALPHIAGDWHLTIAGEMWGTSTSLVQRIAASPHAHRVELDLGYVSDQHAADLFARADVLVAPYRSATGSAVIALAQHYNRAAIASDIAVMREAVEDGSTGWLFPDGDAAALAAILSQPELGAQATAMRPAIAAVGAARSWHGLAKLALALSQP